MKNNNSKKSNGFVLIVLICIISSFVTLGACVLSQLTLWYIDTFNIDITTLLFTLKSPLKGADTNFLKGAVSYILPKFLETVVVCIIICYILLFVFERLVVSLKIKIKEKSLSISLRFLLSFCFIIFSLFFALKSLYDAEHCINYKEYKRKLSEQTHIYENYYIDPKSVDLVSPKLKKNLIYIYMESMETTYASEMEGGSQVSENYIPYLTRLAQENVSFSNKNDLLGGYHNTIGTQWTIAALFATESGVPFSFPVTNNSMDSRTTFASGITMMGDILKDNGYNQEFLCGSEGEYAGRKDMFIQHGNYYVFDLFTAREKGYISEDYKVWWGFEDEILYKIARDEVIRLSNEPEPFNLTLLTVDTHHVGGYKCNICGDEYEENLANVVACADRQVYDFITWIKEQPFYKDTVIVITGDHPRMDTILVGDTSYFDRTTYNCFINSQIPKTDIDFHNLISNRVACSMDMFPTVLSALGFEIPGNRLGLGTDLFSGEKTLAEELGYDYFNEEVSKYSQWYIINFS